MDMPPLDMLVLLDTGEIQLQLKRIKLVLLKVLVWVVQVITSLVNLNVLK